MIYKNKNFSFTDPKCSAGDELIACNITQAAPNTEICKGLKVTFTDCNLVNCVPPAEATVNGGNTAQISRCTHEHPELIERGLKACAEDCEHRDGSSKQRVETDEKEFRKELNSLSASKPQVKITKSVDSDGITQQAFEKEVFVYKDKVIGRFKPSKISKIGGSK